MKKVGGILRFIKAVIFVLNYAIAAYVVNIFGSGEKFLKSRTGTGAKKLMDITGATITVSGTENIDTNKHYIFVGNHRSYTDILVLFAAGGVAGNLRKPQREEDHHGKNSKSHFAGCWPARCAGVRRLCAAASGGDPICGGGRAGRRPPGRILPRPYYFPGKRSGGLAGIAGPSLHGRLRLCLHPGQPAHRPGPGGPGCWVSCGAGKAHQPQHRRAGRPV